MLPTWWQRLSEVPVITFFQASSEAALILVSALSLFHYLIYFRVCHTQTELLLNYFFLFLSQAPCYSLQPWLPLVAKFLHTLMPLVASGVGYTFFFVCFWLQPCSMRDVSSPTRDPTLAAALEDSLCLWTTREVPVTLLKGTLQYLCQRVAQSSLSTEYIYCLQRSCLLVHPPNPFWIKLAYGPKKIRVGKLREHTAVILKTASWLTFESLRQDMDPLTLF